MENIYCWLHASSPDCSTTMSNILFIGNENKCVEFANAITEDSFDNKGVVRDILGKAYLMFDALNVHNIDIKISAGSDKNRVEKYFYFNFE